MVILFLQNYHLITIKLKNYVKAIANEFNMKNVKYCDRSSMDFLALFRKKLEHG